MDQKTTKIFDVVCGMEIPFENTEETSEYNGEKYYFCSRGCKTHFDKEPEKYAPDTSLDD
ncbi:YHS domain-containing protein [Candidatus Parcubacteria bacterium]|nr:MAG: YHS domain-containing protein [Candidatus Parcubacteria bacterium]